MLKGVALLLTGTLGAQLVAVGTSPLLSRLYTPEDFGVFGIYLAITNILLTMSTARYENAILLPSLDTHALWLRRLSLLVALGLMLAGVAGLAADALTGGHVMHAIGIGWLIWIIPMTVILLGFHQAMSAWLLRSAEYRRIATSRIVRASSAAASQIAFAFGGFGPAGLILGQAIGHTGAAGVLVTGLGNSARMKWARPTLAKLLASARAYARFPKWELPQALLNSTSQQLPILILSAIFDAAIAGAYVMSSRVLLMPVALLGQSLRQAMARQAAIALRSTMPAYASVRSGLLVLSSLGLVPAIVLMIHGRDLFTLVFGGEWGQAGDYAAFMAPWLLMLFVKESVLGFVPALNLQRMALVFEVVGFPLRASALVLGANLGGALWAIGALSVVGVATNAAFIVAILWRLRLRDKALVSMRGRGDGSSK